MNKAEAEEKFRACVTRLRGLGSLAVAFSGGVDSTLLLAAAREALGRKVLALTDVSVIHAASETDCAAKMARYLHVRHHVFDSRPQDDEAFRANTGDRCYHCKRRLFSKLWALARESGLEHVAHGANWDDLDDYRPGFRAAEECRVSAPFVDQGVTKEEVRYLAERMGLPNWNRPAMACLATRVAYGEVITEEKLKRIEAAEAYLNGCGFSGVRVRCHGEVARIEADADVWPRLLDGQVRAGLVACLRRLGFHHVAVDLEGYLPGKMNRDLP